MKAFVGKAITLAAILALMAVSAVSLSSCGTDPIAEVPDPEYFYAETGLIDEINEHDDVKQVILRSDGELWTHAAAYVNLLKYSGKYKFVSFDEDLYPSGDYLWNFEYSGSEEVKDAYFAQIEINYYKNTNGRDNYAVWITLHDLDNFELVQDDTYDPENIYGTEPAVQETQATQATQAPSDTITYTESPASSWDDDSGWEDDSSDDFDDDIFNDDSNSLYDAKPICGVCDGDGDCGTCGGDGYLHSSASDEEDRNCYSCSGSGNCRSCGGDGEL